MITWLPWHYLGLPAKVPVAVLIFALGADIELTYLPISLPIYLPCKLLVINSVSVSYLLYSLAQVLFGIRAQFQCCLIGGALALR